MTAPMAPHTGGTLAIRDGQTEFTPVQRAALAQIGVADATDADLAVFLHYAQRTGLDPFSRQIYMIKREGKQTIQTGIDGFRLIAQRTGKYRGKVSTEWCGPDGEWRDVWLGGLNNPPFAARVSVKHADHDLPDSATCIFDEFVGRKFNGEVNRMWETKPATMLAKCSESGALRAAFPNDLGGMYTDDEMMAADNPQPGPRLPNTVDGTVTDAAAPNPNSIDWDAMIAERVAVIDTDATAAHAALRSLLAQARQMIPAQGATLNKIAKAMQEAKNKIPADAPAPPKATRDPAQPALATAKQKAAIAALITKGGVTGKNAQHLVAARLCPDRGDLLLSFNELTAAEAGSVLDVLNEWERDVTLVDGCAALVPADDDPVWDEIAVARANAENAKGG